ncbi:MULTISPECIES: ChbG/HpnK family deacetylase [unclassified Pseudonocardia]|uniref:ChbG/HpnK family deacetylase n=1 Tax=unclassified Pseudonocardia TaxID=2619320 RepID=UPI0001FFEDF3|nr:ChbG/HpnK family deacetylase [Pseudonocardia sp. Ae707_Ps1]OLM20334.1 Cellobiose phosphotransferase system YdjC-like protein [Pseudonocardia sp. Ae707_Ps1]
MHEPLASEILGLGPCARVLLINADDFGMHPAVNRGILAALDHGIARSTSLMTMCPGTDEAIGVLRHRPDIPFGIHLTLVRDHPADDWRPQAGADEVSSLVDERGRFPLHADAADVLRRVRTEEVAIEFRAQIATVMDGGLRPTHLDFHCLADGGRPDLLAVATDLAEQYGLAVRVWLPTNLVRPREAGLPVVDHPFVDSFTIDPGRKASLYEQMLRDLRPGLTEWAVHPAVHHAGARTRDPHGLAVRTTDYEFLTSPRAAEVICQEGITLVDYRPFQRLWRDRGVGSS